MAAGPGRNRRKGVIATLVFLVPVVAFVIYASLQVNKYACEVCISFQGRETCRTVIAKTRKEALRGATDNACALLSSGVTDTLRCARTVPRRAECREAGG